MLKEEEQDRMNYRYRLTKKRVWIAGIADYVQNVMNPSRYGWQASGGQIVSK